MRVYAWNVPVQVQILSPHPLIPSSCLRTECILRKCCMERKAESSQLMSPHGMHHNPNKILEFRLLSQLMSPHGMHRILALPVNVSRTPNSCLRTECIVGLFGGWSMALAPNSCLRTECIHLLRSRRLRAKSSQLMSPHGMHPPADGAGDVQQPSQLMSPHGMHRFE